MATGYRLGQHDQRKYPAPLRPVEVLRGGVVIGPGAARRTRTTEEFHVTYVIALPCVDVLDRACIEECPVDCIYEGERMLYIHPDECVDCGACEPVCPVEAIYYEDDVPDQWKDYYKVNVDFFEDLGSPGGASKTGKIGKDHPLVAALPPQGEES
jgi:ferredoxin